MQQLKRLCFFFSSAVGVLREPFLLPNYRRFQLMRFTVEEINNSTNLLPNVSLGYLIFDYCADVHSFSAVMKLSSANHRIETWHTSERVQSKVIAVVGPFTSTQARTAAPLLMDDFISMVSLLLLFYY